MTSGLTVDAIRHCLEGVVPAAMATCDRDGVPNVSLLSQVHYLDAGHVALSYQFFNKTRANILANPFATLQLIDPATVAQYRMRVRYLRTETAGPLFETMKAKLAGIASHAGMEGVFRLLGADVYAVEGIEAVPGARLPAPVRDRSLLAASRRTCEGLLACSDLGELVDRTLSDLRDSFGIEHAMVLMMDEAAGRLFTVASLGYEASGVGSEVALGDGVIGVAARERTPIRITHGTSDYAYGRAVRDSARLSGMDAAREIPFPGLAEPRSQLAVPILGGGCGGRRLVGVLFVESREEMRFCYDDEDALALVAAQLGVLIQAIHPSSAPDEAPQPAADPGRHGAPAVVRHHAADDSVFLDHEYLIKGVAGAILWWLAREHARHGRVDFSNRELRLAPDIRLPDLAENLEARLILLQRRLADRCDFIRIEKTGRGRFRLVVQRPLALEEMP